MSNAENIQTVISRLKPDISAKADIIVLAQTRAIEAAPVLMRFCRETDDRYLSGICLDALGTILRNSNHEHATIIARELAMLLEDPRFQRIRPKIARILGRIGGCRIEIVPTLTRVLYSGCRDSVRVPLRGALVRILWTCLTEGTVRKQLDALSHIARLKAGYDIWLLECFLEQQRGTAITRTHAQTLLGEARKRVARRT